MAPSVLLGRDAELAALVEAVEAGRPALIAGEAGVGKTALARAAVAATGRGLREGGGFATLSWLPYLALRRATGVPDLGSPGAVARRVEREVGADVLFIDDLQWVDPETRSIVRDLLDRVRVVAAVRLGDPGAAAASTALEGACATGICLTGLERSAAFDLAARLRPDWPASALAGVVEESGGNPLLIEALAVHERRPAYLDRAIVAQLDDLPVAERAVLSLHALCGRPIGAGELDAAYAAAATDLVERGLLRVVPEGREVRHAIIAAAALAGIDDATRTELAGKVAALTCGRARAAATTNHRQLQDLDRDIAAGALLGALSRADELLRQPMARAERLTAACHRARALCLLGRFEEAEREISAVDAAAVDDPARKREAAACAAETAWWAGRPERAMELADRCLALDAGASPDELVALTRAWALVDLERAPVAGSTEGGARASAAATAEHRGLVARSQGDHRRAALAFDVAASEWTATSLPRALLCSWAAADSRRLAGDHDGAIRDLERVVDRAVAIGFEPLAARARRSIRLAGGHAARRFQVPRTGGLTGREREVLALVEHGLTNAQIARRMSVGRPTVARLLSNAMERLGADSRAHAVMLAGAAG